MTIEVDASELNQLAIDLGAAGARAPVLARQVVQKSSADIKRDGQRFAPVDTGHLMNSITYETRQLPAGAAGEIGPTAEYGRYVEEGTSTMAPRAYMGPALDRNTPAFVTAAEALGVQALGMGDG